MLLKNGYCQLLSKLFVSTGTPIGKKLRKLDWEKAVYLLLFMLANTLPFKTQKCGKLGKRYRFGLNIIYVLKLFAVKDSKNLVAICAMICE